MLRIPQFKLPRALALFMGAMLLLAGAPAMAQQSAPDVCKACHADYFDSYAASKHGAVGNKRGPAHQGSCVACHGQGALEHAKQGGGKGVGGIVSFGDPKVSAQAKSQTCMNCHGSDRQLSFWEAGQHNKNDVACSNCHSLHGTPGAGATIAFNKANPTVAPYQTTVRQLQYETCTACHKQIRSQLTKPSHHPIIEGRVKCSDCHNPHGALSHAMVKAESIPALCTSCHAEKRGPWIWEHAPVEENCLTCHNSHGSNHNRLLAEKAPNVCQDCHDASKHPGTAYDVSGGWIPQPPRSAVPNTRLIVRGCVNCHFAVHGSNAPGNRGQFFLR